MIWHNTKVHGVTVNGAILWVHGITVNGAVSNPQRGTYTYVGMYTYGHTFVSLNHSVQLQTFNSLQKDLPSFINTNNNQTLPYLNHINALLHQAVSTCKAAMKTSKPVQELGEKENIPPKKSLEHQ